MGSTLILPAAGQSRTAATGAGSGAMSRYYVRKGVHYGTADEMIDYIEELEAKLAKAVEALEEAIYLLDPEEEDIAKETGIYRVVTTCKELKGEDQ